MYPFKIIALLISVFLITPICEAKKRCKPLLEKLHNIQAMQRSGYSSKRGISLRSKEDKARDKWWQCEQGKGLKTKNKKKKTAKKKRKTKSSKKKDIAAGTPFKTNNQIVIKSKYQGVKKQAWLNFYQPPPKCSRPKSLAIFASCSEDKQLQRRNFEQEYR